MQPLLVRVGRESAFGQISTTLHHPPLTQLLASDIKQIFLSTNLACLLTSE